MLLNKMATDRHATPFIKHNMFICIFILILLMTNEGSSNNYINRGGFPKDDGGKRMTKEYHLRQGALRGLIVKPSRQYDLPYVEMFLGIPYAAPPTGSLRFMPPVSAPPWSGVKMATRFAPVCPQSFPSIKKENPPSKGRQLYLNQLKAFLTNESEDCLYLNIYVPYQEQKTKKFPVLVFIHGDSFEWSSGNPYDGRMLASYGRVMVITINYRLGILGFIKPSLTEHAYGNNGLLDQLAALQWIKDNIEDMNGDPTSVTLMGHGTGAACVNFVMLSPISDGLFHRAIMMSGSALSDWAMTKDPTPYTLQVAQSLGCNPSSKNMMACMQKKPLSEIKNVQILAREFETPLGPIVAGSFITNEPAKTMESFPNLLSKYQLLCGVTEIERYHDFGVIELEHGILENQRDDFIKKYAKIMFEGAENEVLKSVLKEYAPSKLDPQRWNVETNRDVIVNAFSDARTLAPLIRFADYQSKSNQQSYFYVFGHNSISSDYAALNKSVEGEELPYIFGVPLGLTNTHFNADYTQQEKLLSEVMMKMWSNFVKNGSPKFENPVKFLNLDKRYWHLYSPEWPEYDSKHQSYLRFDIPPSQEDSYRSIYTKFWTDTLPNKMSKFVVDPLFDYTPSTYRPKPIPNKTVFRSTGDPTDQIRKVWGTHETSHYSSSMYGKLRPYSQPVHKPDNNMMYREIMSIDKPAYKRPVPSGVIQPDKSSTQLTTSKPNMKISVKTSSTTITLIISLSILFLAINVGICSILYFKKRKIRLREQVLNNSRQPRAEIGEVDVIGQKNSKDDKNALRSLKNGCNVIKSMSFNKNKKHETKKYKKKSDICKTPKSDDSGGFRERFQLRRHLSTSTLDAHTKVRDWIANEVMHRCSPGILRNSNSDLNDKHITIAKPFTRSEELLSDTKRKNNVKTNDSINSKSAASKSCSRNKTSEKTTSTSALGSHSSIASNKQSLNSKQTNRSNDSLKSKGAESSRSKKISVAIDATPSARTNSILNQEPIEISKSLDGIEKLHSIMNDKSVDVIENSESTITHKTNGDEITFKNVVTLSVDQKPLVISHKHSSSDPVTDVNYDRLMEKMELNNAIDILPPLTFRNDINVTSRDDNIKNPMTADEALLYIKRRNFPKVLPDLPKTQKRLSLQPNSLQTFRGYSTDSQVDRPRIAPQPPPRTTTLERRLAYKNTKQLSSFDPSNVKKINEDFNVNNYENIESLLPYVDSTRSLSFNKDGHNLCEISESNITLPKERVPRVIIASSDIPSSQDPKIVITPSPSQVGISTSGPRVRLLDDFHSRHGSVTSFSSFYSDDEEDDIDPETTFEDFEDKLIKELVGGVDSPTNMNDVLDSKGPETIFEKKLEIVPVKINPGTLVPKLKEDYVCISNLLLPDVSTLEKTAQIKPNFGLNKLQDRTESIYKPPEKVVSIKQKRRRTPSILNRSIKNKSENDRSKFDSMKLEHSNSGSSNDTEASTGTVRKVELLK